jgi:hypothetical protein
MNLKLKLKDIEQLVNSELASKIKKTFITFNELLIETSDEDLIDVIHFLKSHDKLNFRQLIDIPTSFTRKKHKNKNIN